MFRCRVCCVLIGGVLSFCVGALAPVKGIDDLGKYRGIHCSLSEASIASMCVSLNKKLEILRNIESIDEGIRTDVERLANQIDAIERKPHFKAIGLQKVRGSMTGVAKKRCDALSAAMKSLGIRNHSVTVESFKKDLVTWRNLYLEKVIDGIKKNEYSLLLAPLPEGLLMEGYVPNTFSCAVSFLTDSGKMVDIYFDLVNNSLKSSSVPTLFAFESGNSDDVEFFCDRSLREQSNALTGDLRKNPGIIRGPNDLFRHSEQQAFFSLNVSPDVIGEIKGKLAGNKIKEIIFHGNTLRDMCPNCRSTLVGYEMLSIRNALYGELTVDNILCTLQEAVVETTGTEKPPVTCLISSFVEYQDGYRSKDVSWLLKPSYNPLNMEDKAPSGVCTNFVNQYFFSNVEFLSILLKHIKDNGVRFAIEGVIRKE